MKIAFEGNTRTPKPLGTPLTSTLTSILTNFPTLSNKEADIRKREASHFQPPTSHFFQNATKNKIYPLRPNYPPPHRSIGVRSIART